MILACPHCFAVYELPRHLLGPGGAAVRCPHCAGEFTLGADGEVVTAAVGATRAPEATAVSGALVARAAAAHDPGASRTAAAARAPEAGSDSEAAAASAAGAEAGSATARPAAAARAPATPGSGPARATVSMRAPEAALGSAAARADEAEASDRAEAGTDAQAIARRVLDELTARKGPAMTDANGRGRLLSEFGPELAAAFEQFRKESGGTGNPAPFRDALRERWGVDLTPSARG